ncbi:unnamed protein product [Penicillium egyptiacum]|uniref:Uncharacterized protein n=1 Tax=Penicillium egyptiacum TaxID=1303716 RepID=A0A9W4K9Q6_9EURO|nr:unnamed protein product [Penicillium egyptiacum]
MRVLWPDLRPARDFPKSFDEAIMRQIDDTMANFLEFDRYLAHIKKRNITFNDRAMGAFQLVMQSQRNVSTDRKVSGIESDSSITQRSARTQYQHGPSAEGTSSSASASRTSDTASAAISASDTLSAGGISAAADSDIPFRRTKDKQLVNDPLLLFLQALTVHLPDMRCEWSSIRSPFMKASFGNNTMTARIDGCLVGTDTDDIFAIAELKPKVRNRNAWPELLWQEAAEMVPWILHDEEQPRETPIERRMLVSQDNHEIWLTLAQYDKEYAQYLKQEPPTPTRQDPGPSQRPLHFMRMREYGPWKIQGAINMRDSAKILVRWAFEATDVIDSSKPRDA